MLGIEGDFHFFCELKRFCRHVDLKCRFNFVGIFEAQSLVF